MDIKAMEKELAGAGYVCGWHKPIEYAGYIYICVNPLFPGMVKIGYADDLEKRVRGLSGTNVPEPYHCYAAYKVVERLEDKTLHQLIDGFDPNLRYDKGREFYTMSPERAYNILLSIAKISGSEDRLEMNPLNDSYFSQTAASAPISSSKNAVVPPAKLSKWNDFLMKKFSNGFNYKGVSMRFDRNIYCSAKSYFYQQFNQCLPSKTCRSVHYEIMIWNHGIDVVLHVEDKTYAPMRDLIASDMRAKVDSTPGFSMTTKSVKTEKVVFDGRSEDDVYAEVCEKMKSLYDNFEPIVDKYRKMAAAKGVV